MNYLSFQSFDYERTWWRLIQECVVRTKLNIYVFIIIAIFYMWSCRKRWIYISKYIYLYLRLKIKPNSARIRFLSCQIVVLPSTGFELTPLIHCSIIRLALRPALYTTRPHPLIYLIWFIVLNATFSHCSAISWRPVSVVDEYPKRTTDHGQATDKLHHLRLRVECTMFL